MKNTLSTLLIILTICFFGRDVNGQTKLKITDLKIATNNERFQTYSDKVANLASDIPVNILLYRESNVSYYACFLLTQRGKKLKLKVQDYMVVNDEKIKTRKQVIRQKRDDDDENERMTGVTEENLVYSKALGNTLRIIYRFELFY